MITACGQRRFATAMGIAKIDGHAEGGTILFGPKVQIDTGRLVRMIQQEAESYKLEGQEKLRYFYDMEAHARRVEVVNEILDALLVG